MKRKNNTPAYIVNCDNIVKYEDIRKEIAVAKHRAGIPLTDEELEDICENYRKANTPKRISLTILVNKESWLRRIYNKIKRIFVR